MPRDTRAKLQSGTRRKVPFAKTITGTPAAASFTHLFQFGGFPAAGAYSSFAAAALARQQVVGGTSPSVAGGYQTVTNPTAPANNYLTRSTLNNLAASGQGTLYLLDWLVTYKTIDANSALLQTMTASAAGTDQRPRTYDDRSIIFADVSVALGAGAANLTVAYTSTKSGLPSARSTGAQTLTVSSAAGRIPHAYLFLPLQADDPGVASIQTAQLSGAMGAGSAFSLNIANILAEITISTSLVGESINYSNDSDGLIEIPDNAALTWVWCPTSAVATQNLIGTNHITEADIAAA